MHRSLSLVLGLLALISTVTAAELLAQRALPRPSSSVPAASEPRFVANEVVIEVDGAPSPDMVDALARRHGLTRMESQRFRLTGSTLFRWQIPDARSVPDVLRMLSADAGVRSAQPNYVFTLQQERAAAARSTLGDPAQYVLQKLQIPLAHRLSRGSNVLVAVIDSGIDIVHPELTGVVSGTYAAFLPVEEKPHNHGTAVAGAIASRAHLRLIGIAPDARILAINAFKPQAAPAEGTCFNVVKGLEFAVAQGAQIINMSFAGPHDPLLQRALAAAHQQGIVLIAAAGNSGPNSAPLYPAADPHVIAVTATDADDRLFPAANRGQHIAVAAPGVDIALLAADSSYQFASGTSFAAAHVSGVVALLLERKPNLTPENVRQNSDVQRPGLGPKGRDNRFGAGLVDAFRAIRALEGSL